MKRFFYKITSVFALMTLMQFCTQQQQTALSDRERIKAVNPTFQNFDVDFATSEVDAATGKTLRFSNGTTIEVPADAFVDATGKPVRGKVDLKYREFHNAADIIASGIPMTYDSGGVKHQFESAGMFEMRGNQNGKEVFIAKDKNIKVSMASFAEGNNFSFYQLEEPKKTVQKTVVLNFPLVTPAYAQTTLQPARQANWKFLGTAATTPNLRKQNEIEANVMAYEKQLKAEYESRVNTTVSQAQKPGKADKPLKNSCFKIMVDKKSNPELETLENVVWEYTGNDNSKNPCTQANKWTLRKVWPQVELTQAHYKFINLPGHTGQVTCASFAADGKYILTAAGGAAKLWNSRGKLLQEFSGHSNTVYMAVLSPDEKRIFTAAGGAVSVWNRKGKLLHKLGGHADLVKKIEFSPDGKQVIVQAGHQVKTWDENGECLATMALEKAAVSTPQQVNRNTKKLKISATKVLVINNEREAPLVELRGHRKSVNFAAYSPDSSMILSTGNDRMAKIWDKEGILLCNLKTHDSPVQFGAFSPDGKKLLTVAYDENNLTVADPNSVKLWIKVKPQEEIYEMDFYKTPENKEEEESRQYYFSTTVKVASKSKQEKGTYYQMENADEFVRNYVAEMKAKLQQRRQMEEQRLASEANLLRTYNIQDFGTYNWDRLYHFGSDLITQAASFEVEGVKLSGTEAIYHTTAETVVMQYRNNPDREFRFVRNQKNRLLIVLPNDEVAVMDANEFRQSVIAQKEQGLRTYHFKLTKRIKLSSVDELGKLLGIEPKAAKQVS